MLAHGALDGRVGAVRHDRIAIDAVLLAAAVEAGVCYVNSQSARLGAGLMPFDARRVSALVAKTRQWLTDYVSKRSPMDLPETSPQQAMSPAGKAGV